MDKQTIKYYEREAANLAGDYDSCDGGVSDYFQATFSAGMRILEIGCGSGRDLVRLVEMGFDAEGVEPCREGMRVENSIRTLNSLESFTEVSTPHQKWP